MNNRDTFLANIASQLGREVRHTPQPRPQPINDYAQTRLTELTLAQRRDTFIEVASHVMLAHCERCSASEAPQAALRLCERYGRTPAIVSGDERLAQLGIREYLLRECPATLWDPVNGEENLRLAEQAKVGIVFAEYGLAESGGVVLFSSAQRGRALSLLPESSIFVLRQSTILPRVAQLAIQLHQQALRGERMPSCINLIGGPSSTADIELIKVVGVHGPINAAYLIIDDC